MEESTRDLLIEAMKSRETEKNKNKSQSIANRDDFAKVERRANKQYEWMQKLRSVPEMNERVRIVEKHYREIARQYGNTNF